MGFTPLFVEMRHKKVVIIGTGEVGSRRAKRFLKSEAEVIVIGNNIPKDLIELGVNVKSPEEIEMWVEWADIVVTASGDPELNQLTADMAGGKLINRPDIPDKGNLIIPSSFFIGDVQICISTNGKSPLIAKELRKKIQKVIKNEDVLQLELQDFARKLLRNSVNDQKVRKEYLYNIFEDLEIQKLLKEDNLDEAKRHVHKLIPNKNNGT